MTSWYLNRLKTFTFAEFPYRIKQLVQKKYEQYFSVGKSLKQQSVITRNYFQGFRLNNRSLYPEMINVFGKDFNYTNHDINWHRDIFSDKCYPLKFSKALNINSNPGLSAKAVWEINRLQFLPQIALNYKNTGSDIYLTQFTGILNSWIDQNPYLLGINWYSNIEVNIRIINWYLSWKILDVEKLIAQRPDFKNFVETRWLPSIYQHCRYSYKNPSKYSSANNHLISEYAGLFIASSLWKFKETEKWLKYSRKGLEEEMNRQHSSGINREEAAEYIQFITDFFLLCFIVGEKTNRPFSKKYEENLHKIFRYVNEFLDCNGDFPNYGDEDDGKCFIIDTDKKFNNFKSLLTSGAVIFKDPSLKYRSNGYDLKNQFLFGETGRADYESIPDIENNMISKFYKNEGHYIFRKKEATGEIYMHFDAAPLGYLSIAAHGHADALSFILHLDGHPVFIDSGTYTYHTEPGWRHYFIGTLAHNTVRINGKDQALNGGPTLWTRHYKTHVINVELTDSAESVRATHDGYKNENVRHVREIVFDKNKNEFQILDTINVLKKGIVQVEIPFHLHPDIIINQLDPGLFQLSGGSGRKSELHLDKKLNPMVLSGQVNPQVLGWYSSSFMKKEATNVIYCKTQIEKTTTFRFLIKIN